MKRVFVYKNVTYSIYVTLNTGTKDVRVYPKSDNPNLGYTSAGFKKIPTHTLRLEIPEKNDYADTTSTTDELEKKITTLELVAKTCIDGSNIDDPIYILKNLMFE